MGVERPVVEGTAQAFAGHAAAAQVSAEVRTRLVERGQRAGRGAEEDDVLAEVVHRLELFGAQL
jgi:hypothetical protein